MLLCLIMTGPARIRTSLASRPLSGTHLAHNSPRSPPGAHCSAVLCSSLPVPIADPGAHQPPSMPILQHTAILLALVALHFANLYNLERVALVRADPDQVRARSWLLLIAKGVAVVSGWSEDDWSTILLAVRVPALVVVIIVGRDPPPAPVPAPAPASNVAEAGAGAESARACTARPLQPAHAAPYPVTAAVLTIVVGGEPPAAPAPAPAHAVALALARARLPAQVPYHTPGHADEERDLLPLYSAAGPVDPGAK